MREKVLEKSYACILRRRAKKPTKNRRIARALEKIARTIPCRDTIIFPGWVVYGPGKTAGQGCPAVFVSVPARSFAQTGEDHAHAVTFFVGVLAEYPCDLETLVVIYEVQVALHVFGAFEVIAVIEPD